MCIIKTKGSYIKGVLRKEDLSVIDLMYADVECTLDELSGIRLEVSLEDGTLKLWIMSEEEAGEYIMRGSCFHKVAMYHNYRCVW